MNLLLALSFAALYLALGVRDLRVPGPYADELFQVTPALQILAATPPAPIGPASLNLDVGGRYLPLYSSLGYIGGLKTFALLPGFVLAGIELEALRATTLALGACGIVLSFLFLARFAGRAAALIAGALLATDPSYLLHTRLDWGPTAFMFALKALALYALWRWWTSPAPARRAAPGGGGQAPALPDVSPSSMVAGAAGGGGSAADRAAGGGGAAADRAAAGGGFGWLVLGGLSLGLGLYDKLNFLWFVSALIVAVGVLAPRALARRLDRRTLIGGGAAFVLGSTPVLLANLAAPGWSIAPVADGLRQAPRDGLLVAAWGQLEQRLSVVAGVLRGDIVPNWILQAPIEHQSFLGPLLAVAVILFMVQILMQWWGPRPVGRGLVPRRPSAVPHHPASALPDDAGRWGEWLGAWRRGWGSASYLRRTALWLLLPVLIFAEVVVTPQATGPHHAMMVYPFPQFLVGMVLGLPLARRVAPRLPLIMLRGLLIAGIGLVVWSQWQVTEETFGRLGAEGPRGGWSESIYRVNDFLTERAGTDRVAAMDWGIHPNLLLLSRGRLQVTEPLIFQLQFNPSPNDRAEIGRLLEGTHWFLLHAPAVTHFTQARAAFLDELAAREVPHEEHWFYERDGAPYLVVIRTGPLVR